MAHLTRLGVLLAAVAVLAPSAARAESEGGTKYHFELGAFLSATWYPSPLGVDAGVVDDRVFGYGGALSLAYRGPYFLYPFLEAGYFDLASSTIHPLTRTGISSDRVENGITTWSFMAGPGMDFGMLRFRIGLGLIANDIVSEGSGFKDDHTAYGLINCLQVSAFPYRTTGFRLGVELRAARLIYLGSSFMALGISGAGDWLSW